MPEAPQTHFICYRCATVPDDPREAPKGHLVFLAAPTGLDPADSVPTTECTHCGHLCRELPVERTRRLAQAEGRLGANSEEAQARTMKALAAAAWRHGRYSQAAVGPACRINRDDKDAERCKSCEYHEPENPASSLCIPVDKCLRDENRWLRILHAYDTGNPAHLKAVYGEAEAHAVALLMNMVEAVERGELTIQQPAPGSTIVTGKNEDGEEVLAGAMRTEINPIIPELVKLIKVLGVDPASWRMTTQSAGTGAKDDAERDAAKAQMTRDARDILSDPNTPEEIKQLLVVAAQSLLKKGTDGDNG
jgi:hypothetical protein